MLCGKGGTEIVGQTVMVQPDTHAKVVSPPLTLLKCQHPDAGWPRDLGLNTQLEKTVLP